jgi:hypothetical protein
VERCRQYRFFAEYGWNIWITISTNSPFASTVRKPGEAFLSSGAASNGCGAKHLQVDCRVGQNRPSVTTTYWGYLSKVDTPIIVNALGNLRFFRDPRSEKVALAGRQTAQTC